MAATIDIATPRTLWGVVRNVPEPKTFLTDMFFPDGKVMPTEVIDVDYVEGNRNELPTVSPIADGIVIEKQGFERRMFQGPYWNVLDVITGKDLVTALAGEDPYNPAARLSKLQFLQAQGLGTCRRALTRIKEIMSSRTLQTGITTVYRHVNGQASPVAVAQVDWCPAAKRATHFETNTGTDLWDNGSVDILAVLTNRAQVVTNDSGIAPDTLIVGETLAPYFWSDTKLKALLDNRRIDMGLIKPEVYGNRSSYIGHLTAPGLSVDIWCYHELYTNALGASTKMVDAKKFILGSKNAGTTMAYGAIQNLRALVGGGSEGGEVLDAGKMFVSSTMADNGKSLTTQVESAPCACMMNALAWYCGNGLA